MKQLTTYLLLFCIAFAFAQKPKVWLISDGGDKINDPDDISALASYILMSNHFDTRAIVMASTVHPWNKDTADQGKWATDTYGIAYAKDLPNLNKYIGGFQKSFRFIESSVKGMGENFQWKKPYNLKDFPSVLALYKELEKTKGKLNILCYGPLTEQAILVSYCKRLGRIDLLNKIRFISHWTSSNFHVGTLKNPEHVHNCFGDPIACDYIKKMALNGDFEFYEAGGIGQYGIVEGGQKGKPYFDQFLESNLGTIFRKGKFHKNRVDDSDSATYWALLGNHGVSLSDMANNGLNYPEAEKRNEMAFALHANDMRNELLRRSNAAAGFDPNAIKIDIMVPEHGMADPHAWVENDTLWFICGHDKSWEPEGSFPMDRWEIWSSTDLRTFKYHNSIEPKDLYIGDKPNCWAGDITKRNEKYYWFFSNRNIDTGVAVADKIDGDYKDLLGKPLLPKDIVPEHPYDPEIFEAEDGQYHIIFGVGKYYMTTLSEDMKSLESAPKHVPIKYKDGREFNSEDKPTLFKRDNKYYLVFGSRYAMSDNLYGPYTFEGAFLDGGHTSFFDWHGQKYVLQENHDICAFYRGASLKPVFFNEDGTVRIPKSDRWYPGPGRPFKFKNSTMGWKALRGSNIYLNDGILSGKISEPKALIQSAPWLFTKSEGLSKITIKIKNSSYANHLKLSVYSRNMDQNFWQNATEPVDWSAQQWVSIPISSNDTEYKTYTIPISKFKKINKKLMQIAIQPAVNTYNGTWEIDEIIIE
ncbi:family 43 glycosylhydrolase [Seonamhaeicola maritimus]|uniref:Family 43 glycosylhydrolase n=1 Tax=Seonamhaeicola maritimus TaxID=2591822 RepID=A0A5C7GJ31_9FLAO|nr:family 43 glycosylhydrolase [Seonamhaeicola maritimus]TXG38378.1 family 43 glycosylhydrolase [Seonamhaeicola maritimus]